MPAAGNEEGTYKEFEMKAAGNKKDSSSSDSDDDLYPAYFRNQGGRGKVAYVKPRGLSFDDLAASPESDKKAQEDCPIAKRKASAQITSSSVSLQQQSSSPNKEGQALPVQQ